MYPRYNRVITTCYSRVCVSLVFPRVCATRVSRVFVFRSCFPRVCATRVSLVLCSCHSRVWNDPSTTEYYTVLSPWPQVEAVLRRPRISSSRRLSFLPLRAGAWPCVAGAPTRGADQYAHCTGGCSALATLRDGLSARVARCALFTRTAAGRRDPHLFHWRNSRLWRIVPFGIWPPLLWRVDQVGLFDPTRIADWWEDGDHDSFTAPHTIRLVQLWDLWGREDFPRVPSCFPRVSRAPKRVHEIAKTIA